MTHRIAKGLSQREPAMHGDYRAAVRWIGLAPIEGRRLLLATDSLSALGYDRDLTDRVIHAWNARAVDGGWETT